MCIVVIVMHDKGSSPSQFIPHNRLYMMVLQAAKSCMGGSQKSEAHGDHHSTADEAWCWPKLPMI